MSMNVIIPKTWNVEQADAIRRAAFGQSFCLIGSAGTGKTTVQQGITDDQMENYRLPIIEQSTKQLVAGTPGIAIVSYTRRAVRNIRLRMSEQLKPHCMTIHALLEYEPEYYEEQNEQGQTVNRMRFAPQRNKFNKLPASLKMIVVEEASMVASDLFALILDALPNPDAVQFIFLGDLNQLPPVYGHPILGIKLTSLPVVELTHVYRQALESPIIAAALSVKNNNFAQFNKDAEQLWGAPHHWDAKNVQERITLNSPGKGKVTIIPWKRNFDASMGLKAVAMNLHRWLDEGLYDPDEDLMLCPWAKSFGTDELNKYIADYLGKKRGAMVWEIIAGFNKLYYAVGDKLMVDKNEAMILDIYRNPKYMGVHTQAPSKDLNRWGKNASGVKEIDIVTDDDVDDFLASFDVNEPEDRVTQASHIVKVRMMDTDQVVLLDKAAQLNFSSLGYAITVHKAQGSEARRVFFVTGHCHAAMCSRELVYTALTRAREELVILMAPMMLKTAAAKPRIKGDTLAAKLEFFKSRMEEKINE